MEKTQKLTKIKMEMKRIRFNFGNFIELVDRYLGSTHLHGCRYIMDKRYNTFASVYWIILLLLSFTFCLYMIFLQLSKFYDSPILNIITSTAYPVWKSAFPTVVVCNRNLVYKNNTRRVTNILQENGVDDDGIEEFLYSLPYLLHCDDCFENESMIDINNVTDRYSILKLYGYSIPKLMKELAHPCSSMLEKCKWQTRSVPCTNIFKLIKTSLGYCCAFNYYATKEEQSEKKQPYYIGGVGFGSGLTITVNIESSQYLSPSQTTPGVTVFAHNGLKYPQVGVKYSSLSSGDVVSFELALEVFQSDSDIQRFTPEVRDCLFEYEGNLKWTEIYNSQTCFNECKANYIVQLCSCIPFYYPVTGSTRVCTFSDISCLLSNKAKFTNVMLSNDLETDNKYVHEHGIKDIHFCYCLPSCNEVTYTFLERKQIMNLNDSCHLNIYYNNVGGILRVRAAILSWDTFLGTIGGTFGLCMGGSVISLFEFIFHFAQVIIGRRLFVRRAVKPHTLKIKVIPKPHALHM